MLVSKASRLGVGSVRCRLGREASLLTTYLSTLRRAHQCSVRSTRAGCRTYSGGQEEIVYLVTDIDRIVESGSDFVFTDRNARSAFERFENDLSRMGALVDWPLMEGRMWNDTAEEPDRMERRMAEFLVHRHVKWDLILGVAAIDEGRCREAEAALATMGVTTAVCPRPKWYF